MCRCSSSFRSGRKKSLCVSCRAAVSCLDSTRFKGPQLLWSTEYSERVTWCNNFGSEKTIVVGLLNKSRVRVLCVTLRHRCRPQGCCCRPDRSYIYISPLASTLSLFLCLALSLCQSVIHIPHTASPDQHHIAQSCRRYQRSSLTSPETLYLPVSWTDEIHVSSYSSIWLVGLPIGMGAISGIITGKTSRSNWFTASWSACLPAS